MAATVPYQFFKRGGCQLCAFPSVSTYSGPQANSDGSIDVYFGPEAPAGKENNWIQTVPGKGWFVLFRFYGPLKPFFDKTWKPDDVEQER